MARLPVPGGDTGNWGEILNDFLRQSHHNNGSISKVDGNFAKLQLRRATSAQWTSANPILAAGEFGIETNTQKRKVGDGVHAWADLPYDLSKSAADELYATAAQGGLADSAVQPGDAEAVPSGGVKGQVLTHDSEGHAWTHPAIQPTSSTDFVFAVADEHNNASWLATKIDGLPPEHSVDEIRKISSRMRYPGEFAAKDSISEWWISNPFTWLGDRLVATLYGPGDNIRAMEWKPGVGIVEDVIIADTDGINDHKAPGHWAAPGERMLVTWQRHNADSKLRIMVSNPGPDIASLTDTTIVEHDAGVPVSYSQPMRIEHLSDDSQHTFWCPYRAGDYQWKILAFSVSRATGQVTIIDTYNFLSRGTGKLYCSFTDANKTSGNQVLRVAAYEHPTGESAIWYLEIDCVTGDVTSRFDSGISFNVLSAENDLNTGSSLNPNITPAVPRVAGTRRRLFYCSPGPFEARIAYAEWLANDEDNAKYKVFDVRTANVTDHGPAGTRFGYDALPNYLCGMCFDNPAFDDTVYVARNPIAGKPTIERIWTSRGTATSKVLLEGDETVFTRPIRPVNDPFHLMYFDQVAYGITGTFVAEGSTRSIRNR